MLDKKTLDLQDLLRTVPRPRPEKADDDKTFNFITMGYLNADKKQELFANYGKSNTDTGSPESQVALFSYRINHLTAHLKKNKKDFGTQRSLLRLVGKRRQLLEYLKKVDIERYRAIVKALELRK